MPNRSKAELMAFADDHLLYEIAMVAGLTKRLRRFLTLLDADPANGDELVGELFDLTGRNADIESLAVHTRVLVEFFYGREGRARAIAADFFDRESDWAAVRPKRPRSLQLINKRVGEEIAHLSYQRNAPAKNWDYEAVWRDLRTVVAIFAEHAANDRISNDWRTKVRAILTEAEQPDRADAISRLVRGGNITARVGATTIDSTLWPRQLSQGGTAVLPPLRESSLGE